MTCLLMMIYAEKAWQDCCWIDHCNMQKKRSLTLSALLPRLNAQSAQSLYESAQQLKHEEYFRYVYKM